LPGLPPSPTFHRFSREIVVSDDQKKLTIWSLPLEKANFSLHDCQENSIPGPFHFGCIAGAGPGVFEEEPKIHPALLERESIVLMPHIDSAVT